jgi:hypothetical protein
MADLTFRSPGVAIREIDLSGGTSILPSGLPAVVISTTQYGPAYVPVTVPTLQDWRTYFGVPSTYINYGALAATEWFRTQQALTQIRVLGVGTGLERTDSGNNRGKVTSAGFVVGDQQPQSSLSGGLGNNAYANAVSAAPNATGSAGRTYFLGCYMSQSAGSTFFTDAGLAGSAVPVVRGIIFAASGVILRLSSSKESNSSLPDASTSADFSAGTVRGYLTGTVNLSGSAQEFVMLLNGHKGTSALFPRAVTASFDPSAPNYLGNALNRDPLKLEEAGYVLYSHYEIQSAIAVPTGSGIVLNASGGLKEHIAFLLTGSQTRNSGSATAPNYENFEDRYRAAHTPWFISQRQGGTYQNLFRLHMISDGDCSDRIKVSIENISPSTNDANPYGTFDVVVRDFNDTDGNKVVLEAFRGLTLNPSSEKYIAKQIGDKHVYYNFDIQEDQQGLAESGNYDLRSRYVRVEMDELVDNGDTAEELLPLGFRGPQHLVTSGSAPFPAFSDSGYLSVTNPFYNTVEPPIPYRTTISKGTGNTKTADRSLYWGVQFERVASVSEPNSSTIPNSSLTSRTKYYPNFQLDWMDVVVDDNEGVSDTAANGILDADRFCNNLFSLEKIQIYYNSATNNTPNTSRIKDWTYVRSGNIATNTTNLTRALTVTDLTEPTTRTVGKYTCYFYGGFDGVRIFDRDTKYLTNKAVSEEMDSSNRGFSNGPTVKAFNKALDLVSDNTEVDGRLFVIPGIRHEIVTDAAINVATNTRSDIFYIFDIEERDVSGNNITDTSTQDISISQTITNFRNRGLNSSYAAAYFPDVIIRDDYNKTSVRVPPTVAVLGAYGLNDLVGHPWFAPAGFTRGALNSVDRTAVTLKQENLDDLYPEKINPITAFQGQGVKVWGQKTVNASVSALERINVRRLMLTLRRRIRSIAKANIFEQYTSDALLGFQRLIEPVLKEVQDLGGVDQYKVQIDTTTTTKLDIANRTIRGIIVIRPTKSLEFLDVTFTLTRDSVTFSS